MRRGDPRQKTGGYLLIALGVLLALTVSVLLGLAVIAVGVYLVVTA